MPRIRTIKPEFFTSPDTARVSHAARLLYIAMWCWADDYGRGELNLLQLRAFAFPEEDRWLEADLNDREPVKNLGKEFQSLCKEVVNGFKLRVYTHRGRTFYAIPSWDDHQKTQRRAKSKFPSPEDEESNPDLRFHDREGISERTQGTSESMQGISERTQGNTPIGTGEQGNRGTGEEGTYTLDQAPHDLKCESERDSDTSELTRILNPDPPESIPDTSRGYPGGFEQWWATYPRRVGKRKAFEAWYHAISKRVQVNDLQAATERFAAFHDQEATEERFIPHPTTWLGRDGWHDDTTPRRKQGPAARLSDEQVLMQVLAHNDPANTAESVIDGEIINQRQIG